MAPSSQHPMDANSSTPADKPWSSTVFDVVRWLLTGLALLAAVFVSMPPAHAAAPAGSQIGNQASATDLAPEKRSPSLSEKIQF
jgi:hypothetical protein